MMFWKERLGRLPCCKGLRLHARFSNGIESISTTGGGAVLPSMRAGVVSLFVLACAGMAGAQESPSIWDASSQATYLQKADDFRSKAVRTTYRETQVHCFALDSPHIEVVEKDGARIVFRDKSPDSKSSYYLDGAKTYSELHGELVAWPGVGEIIEVKTSVDGEELRKGADFIMRTMGTGGWKVLSAKVGDDRVYRSYTSTGETIQTEKETSTLSESHFNPFGFLFTAGSFGKWKAEDCEVKEAGIGRVITCRSAGGNGYKVAEEIEGTPLMRESTGLGKGMGRASFLYQGTQWAGGLPFPTAMRQESVAESGMPGRCMLVDNIKVEVISDEAWDAAVAKMLEEKNAAR